jgi:hypothetical protein
LTDVDTTIETALTEPTDSNDTGKTKPVVKRVILMQPDSNMSVQEWLVYTDAANTLPYLLSDAGYDVWVGNNRGTVDFSSH